MGGRRRRWIGLLWLCAAVAAGVWGCQQAPNDPNSNGGLHFENAETLRIASALPSVTETLYALGLEDRIAAVTSNCDYPPEAKEKESIGDFSLNYEKIAALKIDAVIGARGFTDASADRLRELGVQYAAMDSSNMDAVARSIKELGKAFGAGEKARELVQTFDAAIERAAARAEGKKRPTVFWVQWNQPLSTVGPGNFHHDLIQKAGGENIASDLGSAYAPFSEETLILRNPEILLVHGKAAAEWARRRFPSLEAVRSDRVYLFSFDEAARPGPRLPAALDRLSQLLHPES